MAGNTTPLSFRHVQIIWGVAIAFAVVCIVFGGFTRKPFEGRLSWRHGILLGLVAWSVIGGISILRKLLRRARSGAKASNSGASAKAWAAAQLLGIMLAESIVAWGLVTNIVIASPQWLSDPIYAAGILLLFRFKPSKPSYLSS